MKKIASFIIVCLVLIASFNVGASEIDLTGKTVEELLEIRNTINNILAEQKELITMECGTYVVGRDIAPGSYTLTLYAVDPENVTPIYYTIWRSTEDKQNYEAAHNEYDRDYYAAFDLEMDGKEYTYPAEVNDALYCEVCEERVVNGASFRVNLEEGFILKLEDSRNNDGHILTIEKTTGLFME